MNSLFCCKEIVIHKIVSIDQLIGFALLVEVLPSAAMCCAERVLKEPEAPHHRMPESWCFLHAQSLSSA